MLGRLLAGVVVAAGLIAAGSASAQVVEFRGGGFATDFEGCEPFFRPGDQIFVRARFRPAGLGSNDSSSRLTLLFPVANFSFILRDGSFDSTFRLTDGHVAGIEPMDMTPAPRVRFDTQNPARLRANTPDVYVEGTARRLLNNPACSMRFAIGFVRSPF